MQGCLESTSGLIMLPDSQSALVAERVTGAVKEVSVRAEPKVKTVIPVDGSGDGGLMDIVFQVADDQGLLLLDLDDLQAMLVEVGQNAKEIGLKYGNVAPATVGAVQRKLLSLRNQGGEFFFRPVHLSRAGQRVV